MTNKPSDSPEAADNQQETSSLDQLKNQLTKIGSKLQDITATGKSIDRKLMRMELGSYLDNLNILTGYAELLSRWENIETIEIAEAIHRVNEHLLAAGNELEQIFKEK